MRDEEEEAAKISLRGGVDTPSFFEYGESRKEPRKFNILLSFLSMAVCKDTFLEDLENQFYHNLSECVKNTSLLFPQRGNFMLGWVIIDLVLIQDCVLPC